MKVNTEISKILLKKNTYADGITVGVYITHTPTAVPSAYLRRKTAVSAPSGRPLVGGYTPTAAVGVLKSTPTGFVTPTGRPSAFSAPIVRRRPRHLAVGVQKDRRRVVCFP